MTQSERVRLELEYAPRLREELSPCSRYPAPRTFVSPEELKQHAWIGRTPSQVPARESPLERFCNCYTPKPQPRGSSFLKKKLPRTISVRATPIGEPL